MATSEDTFKSTVIDPIAVNLNSQVHTYSAYISLDKSLRSNDEADVVDNQFTKNLLKWLGYDAGDIIYNRTTPGRPQDKPDFVVKIAGSIAFVVEDKSTDEKFDDKDVMQVRRYTAGTSGYCLWTNARVIIGLRFEANGSFKQIVEVQVEKAFGPSASPLDQSVNFDTLHLLFHRNRFTSTSGLLSNISLTEEEWKNQANPIIDQNSVSTFIDECRVVLTYLTTSVKARLVTVFLELEGATVDLIDTQDRYTTVVTEMLGQLKNNVHPPALAASKRLLELLRPIIADVDASQITAAKPKNMSTVVGTTWDTAETKLMGLISAFRERELARAESRRIRAAYLVWRERYKVIEDSITDEAEHELERRRQTAFAEQVSYIFFVRLLMARILEDKRLMQRIVSDGGFSAWHTFLTTYIGTDFDDISSGSFLPLVYRRVAGFYKHFFQQAVFDWFIPDDYLVILVLDRLNKYDFSNVSSDILGFTYESFIDRIARNKKGHFLTPPEVVDYILDRAGYAGASIVGESMLDPACGSGSFLVHAARRLRLELAKHYSGAQLAHEFIRMVRDNFVGLEINPFSCYLAELNLFIQIIEDLALLWQTGAHENIDKFNVYNSNSLEMPVPVLYKTAGVTVAPESDIMDEGINVKSEQGRFTFVICNPPYVNRGIILGAKSYKDFPFFSEILQGDENFYLLFLRLAEYYASDGGTITFICPLNLFGDESSQKARERLSDGTWSICSLTRFYSRTILFPGVLQGVCVIRFDKKHQLANDILEMRGGFSIADAEAACTSIKVKRITKSYLGKTTWRRAWLVNANPHAYGLWQFITKSCGKDVEDTIKDKLDTSLGDVRATWARLMETSKSSSHTVQVTKGQLLEDWGSCIADKYLDPRITIPEGVKNYKSLLWVQKSVQRIKNLESPEIALFIKEISGLEMKRPIRGTIVTRDATHPIAADHTIAVFRTLDIKHEEFAFALFGLLTSSTFNLLFNLFSTNAHANLNEILRTPVPEWSTRLQARLAVATKNTFQAYQLLRGHQITVGIGNDKQSVSALAVMKNAHIPMIRLEDWVLQGKISITGANNRKLKTLWTNDEIIIDPTLLPTEKDIIIELILEKGDKSYIKEGKDIALPSPKAIASLVAHMSRAVAERGRMRTDVNISRGNLDDMVLDAYGIKRQAWRELIELGLPWTA